MDRYQETLFRTEPFELYYETNTPIIIHGPLGELASRGAGVRIEPESQPESSDGSLTGNDPAKDI